MLFVLSLYSSTDRVLMQVCVFHEWFVKLHRLIILVGYDPGKKFT